MKKRIIPALLVMLSVCTILHSQNFKEHVSIPSPNASSLGEYGQTDMSLFSGKANVTIPIYNVIEGELSVPISLNYSTGGIRPNAHPGSVGLGWSLNAGGVITRVVKGNPDERYWFYPNKNKFQNPGYVWQGAQLNMSESQWSSDNNLINITTGETAGLKGDTEPDEFIFNVGGFTGKFVLNNLTGWEYVGYGVWHTTDITVIGQPGLRVEMELRDEYWCEGNNCPAGSQYYEEYFTQTNFEYNLTQYATMFITGIKMVHSNGTSYVFGEFNKSFNEHPESFKSIEHSIDFFSKGKIGQTIDAWYLTTMKSHKGREITFEYEKAPPIISMSRSINMTREHGEEPVSYLFGLINSTVSASNYNMNTQILGKLISPVVLEKITTNNHEIIFTSSLSTQKKYNYSLIRNALEWHIFDGGGDHGIHTVYDHFLQGNKEVSSLDFSTEAREFLYAPISELGKPDVLTCTRFDYPLTPSSYFLDPMDSVWKYSEYAFNLLDFRKIRWLQLDEISIRDINNSIIKEFELKYTSSLSERLRLLSVQEIGAKNNKKPAYTFEYENYSNSHTTLGISKQQLGNSKKLPDYMSLATDHWGYYNGADDPSSSKYGYNIDFENDATLNAGFYNWRNADEDYIYAGILNQINYPAGGYTKYYYEPNSYTKTSYRTSDGSIDIKNVSTKIGGGLRIKEVRNYSGSGELASKKHYDYYNGILGGEAQYFWEDYNIELYSYDISQRKWVRNSVGYEATRFISNAVIPVSSNSNSSIVGYSKVVEYETGNGRIEYYYTNYENYFTNPPGDEASDEKFVNTINKGASSLYTPFNDLSFKRGQLKEQRIYNASNNIVSKTKNEYSANPAMNGDYIRAAQSQLLPVPLCQLCYTLEATAYKIYEYPFNLTAKEVTVYDSYGNNPVTTSESYSYEHLSNFIESKTKETSTGGNLTTKFSYPLNVFESGIFNFLQDLYEGHQQECNTNFESRKQAYLDYLAGCRNSDNTDWDYMCMSNAYNEFWDILSVSGSALWDILEEILSGVPGFAIVGVKDQIFAQTVIPQEEYVESCVAERFEDLDESDLSTEDILVLQTMKELNIISNPLEVITSKDGKVISGNYTKYQIINDKVLPKAYSLLNISNPLESFQEVYVNTEGNIQINNNYDINTIIDAYDDYGNVLQSHQKDDINKSYLWGHNHTYPIVEAVNAKSNQIIYSSLEEDDSWTPKTGYSYVNTESSASVPPSISGKRIGKYVAQGTGHELICSNTIPFDYSSPKKYKFSAWIYSTTPGTWLSIIYEKPNGGKYAGDYQHCNVTNQWQYIKGEFEVPPAFDNGEDVARIRVGITQEPGTGIVYFDEVRLYPSNAQMTTYTYNPLIGMTSTTNPQGITTKYKYNNFGNLEMVKDHKKNILKQLKYHYAGSTEN